MEHAIIVADSNDRIVFLGGGAVAMFGYRENEVRGTPVDILLPHHAKSLQERHETTCLRKDGGPFRAVVTAIAIGDAGGGAGSGDTARQVLFLVEAPADGFSAGFGRIVDRLPNETFLFETATLRCLYANARAEAGGGATRRDFTLFDLLPQMAPGTLAALAAPLHRGERDEISFETVRRRPDGSLQDVRVHLQLLPFPGCDSFVATVDDITELRQLQDRLLRAQKMEAVGQLSSGIAHDFNNLLQVILGNTEDLIEATADGSAAREATTQIRRASERAADQVRQLLAFARARDRQPGTVDLCDVFATMGSMLGRVLGADIDLRIDLETPVCVTCERALLESALLNLAINARHAQPSGGSLTLAADIVMLDRETAAAAGLEPGAYGRLRIADTGTGMAPDVAARAFDPFFTTKDAAHGSGLGLSMVYGFARQSGGDVRIDSRPDQGTVVTLLLPLAEAGMDTGNAVRAGPDRALHPPGGHTVLLVEDDRAERRKLANQLRSLGYTVLEAGNGRAALRRLSQTPRIDLLFSDVVMPGGRSGYDLAAKARRLRPGLKVLFASGHPRRRPAGPRELPGRFRLVAKPFRRAEIERALRKSLSSS